MCSGKQFSTWQRLLIIGGFLGGGGGGNFEEKVRGGWKKNRGR